MRATLDRLEAIGLIPLERCFDQRDIVQAREAGDLVALNEASLGRVWQHVQKSNVKSLGIITAFRNGRTKKENLAENSKLGQDLRSAGLGFFKLAGVWRECQDPDIPYSKCPKDQLVSVREPSLAVVGISEKLIVRLGKKYEQDAVLYLGPETDGVATLLFKNGGQQKVGKFHAGKIAQAYSGVKGKSFTFEWVVQSHADAMTEQSFSPGS